MNFFAAQDSAKKQSLWLVALFTLSIIAIIVIIYFLLVFILLELNEGNNTQVQIWHPETFFTITGVISFIVLGASIIHMHRLSRGGHVVAEMLGGKEIKETSTDGDEQRIYNIVQEMSIASGVKMPRVYILEDRSINAFAAGNTQEDAVIGVTRGSITQLSREELQGVVAHEFSHILNGDMRLNIKIMGVIFGLLVITMIGSFVLRNVRVRSNGKNNGATAIYAIALVLIIMGYIGVFFGRIIQAALSRQREYLADASAVQFTRNPTGLANALRKIGTIGSQIESPRASEASHLFFSEGISSIFASHPPLPDRIRAIYPQWDGSFEKKL